MENKNTNIVEIRKGFDQAIKGMNKSGLDSSKLEVAREYFTNAAFRAKLEKFVFEQNN